MGMNPPGSVEGKSLERHECSTGWQSVDMSKASRPERDHEGGTRRPQDSVSLSRLCVESWNVKLKLLLMRLYVRERDCRQ